MCRREEDRQRERFMWTRMKQYLAKHKVEPRDALHIVERIKPLADGNTLQIEYELTDPKSWEGTWKYAKRWRRVEDRDIAEVSCFPDLNDHMPSTRSKENIREGQ